MMVHLHGVQGLLDATVLSRLNVVMVMLAGAWYSNATVWTALAFFATLAAGAGAMWATMKAVNPKIRLAHDARGIPMPRFEDHEFVIQHRGASLDTPHVIELSLGNQGRRDIESRMFPNEVPLTFEFDRPVIGLLGRPVVRAGTAVPPPMEIDGGGNVSLAPAHLSKGQIVTYYLLFDGPVGEEPTVTGALLNGSVRKQLALGGHPFDRLQGWRVVPAILAGMALVVPFWAFVLVAVVLPDQWVDSLQDLLWE
ncbi:hypothetical protein AMK27_35185 [Streptomyces sp. CB02009]|uniref:hypothetical protein n=1 Tax=Streptomyces sp. CB02009 TaxID=1703938 RepID=UPI00093D1C1C|nr:hypothetical protein [Streptomyces sp. CB02009]OKJ50318.1 hypothetical protein AMK27_35185 [Streptomyces sp. CB02009]